MKIARVNVNNEVFYATVERDMLRGLAGEPFDGIHYDGRTFSLCDATFLSPVLPSKVVCIGKNYKDHALEMGGDVPIEPIIFIKPSTSVIGPEDLIDYPPDCKRLDYEAEIAVVIGKRAKDVPLGAYQDYVLGYTCLNDVTARDIQQSDGQWTRGKGYDTFCPIGPWIETDLPSHNDTSVVSRLNGQVCQNANTSLLINDIDTLVYFVSRVMTLLPGDVIATGTPAGIGPMQRGDAVEVEIGGIGVLRNTVRL